MNSSIAKLASLLTHHGIIVTYNNDDTYSLTHSLTPEQFHEIVLPIFAELNLNPQDESWMPGTPTGDKEDFGYYVFSEETEDAFSCDIWIASNTINWC